MRAEQFRLYKLSTKTVSMVFDVVPFYLTWFILTMVFLNENVSNHLLISNIEKESQALDLLDLHRSRILRGLYLDKLRRPWLSTQFRYIEELLPWQLHDEQQRKLSLIYVLVATDQSPLPPDVPVCYLTPRLHPWSKRWAKLSCIHSYKWSVSTTYQETKADHWWSKSLQRRRSKKPKHVQDNLWLNCSIQLKWRMQVDTWTG